MFNSKLTVTVLASILILGTLGLTDAFAGNHGNNGNNGCEKANPNAKACENNPNTVVKTIKIITISPTGELVPDVLCRSSSVSGELLIEGVTDANGEMVATVSDTVDELFQTLCFVNVNQLPSGQQCNVPLTDPFTEISIVLNGASGCF